MRQLFKRERTSKRVENTDIPSGLGTIREVVIVNNEVPHGDGSTENLLNVIVGYTDLEEAISSFTYSSHTNQEETLVSILKQNGYKEGVDGLQEVINAHYATYEDGQRMMSHIARRITKSDASQAFPLYVRYIPVNAQYLHFNGILRDKWGLHITGVSDALIGQMRELYDMCCAFDLLYDPAKPNEFTVIDFAYDAFYSSRRNVYSNFGLQAHLDTCVHNEQELDEYVAQSIASDTNSSKNASHTFIVKQSNCAYQFGRVMTGAWLMSIYDIPNTETTDMTNPASVNDVQNVQDTQVETNTEVDNDIRRMCIARGILV